MAALKKHCTRSRAAIIVASALLFASACVVDTPEFEQAETVEDRSSSSPRFEPTAIPAPTVEPTATPVPEPTATPEPEVEEELVPPPLPTADPLVGFVPQTQEAGRVRVPIGRTTFILDEARPILQLARHTLIYVGELNPETGLYPAEVDIFAPVARGDDLALFESYEDLIGYVETSPLLTGLEELPPVTIDGLPTRVFEGTLSGDNDRVFFNDPEAIAFDDPSGWYSPTRVRMWIIDEPSNTIIVTAESLEEPGQYSDAVVLATEVLSTIDFSS